MSDPMSDKTVSLCQ